MKIKKTKMVAAIYWSSKEEITLTADVMVDAICPVKIKDIN